MKKVFWIIFGCVLTFLILVGFTAAPQLHNPNGNLLLVVNGEQNIYLEYGDHFQDLGATAIYTDEYDKTSVSVPVEASGHVDTQKLGNYSIRYTAKVGDNTETAHRDVHVIDTVAPIITLVTNPDAYTLPNKPYQEEGFTATDNYDGDLTSLVEYIEKDGVVTYTVSDSSGNTHTVTRTIRYYDPTPPELQLLGNSTIVLVGGETYQEPGFTASDNADGDLTSAVSVSGSVDTSHSGAYTLTYSVSDSFGNSVSAERTVYVISSSGPSEGNGGYIYLTFDDGPSNHTGRLLDILAKYGVKATFFVVNTGNIDIISRAAAEGHTVAIHTTTHNFAKIYTSDEAYTNDLLTMQEIIYQRTGQRPMMFRFPGGSSNTVSRAYNVGIMSRLTQNLPTMGFQYYDWNVDSRDAGGARTADEVFYNVVSGVSKHQTSIVLQHDTCGFSVSAVERIIAWGLANGYTFLPLTIDSPTCHHGVSN